VNHDERVALIQGGIEVMGGVWADFGAGAGAFTRALQACLGDTATIYAVDRDPGALQSQGELIRKLLADFTQPIPDLPLLDGLLIANALHFVTNQEATMLTLAHYLKPGGVFLMVEYDVRLPRGYIPHPLGRERFVTLAGRIGLLSPRIVGERRSPSSGVVMFAACANRPS
jgi:ubiquinone/menaquinone biosynthesis C-methylase UbiE